MVQTGPRRLEARTFERPRPGEDEALVRIEACGVCGTDVDTYDGTIPLRYPVIPGHEPVGRIEAIGPGAAVRWGLAVGDRVAVAATYGCGRCPACLDGRVCPVAPGTHGFTPTSVGSGLWGGYAEVLVLSPGSVPYPIAPHVAPRRAALFNALGAGFAWAVAAPGLRAGERIAVLGPGQRGLACVVAADRAGAGFVAVTGRGSVDAHKLALAPDLGADLVIDVEGEDAVEAVLAVTGGVGVDVVVDTTPHATRPLLDAVAMTRPGGTIVVAGLKGRDNPVPLPTDDIAMKELTVRGVRAVDHPSVRRAIELLESDHPGLDRLMTHAFPLEAAAEAVATLAAAGETGAIAVAIEP